MPCPICSHAGTTPHLTVGSYQYVACTDCGAVRLHPFPDPAATVELYDDTYFLGAANGGYHDYAADAAIHRRNARARLRKLGPPPVPNATLVDVGCAHGYTLLEARERGWAPQGVEVNATARAASSHAGFPTAPALSELGLAPGSVHAITFFQVLEHLPDPAAALREAAALLAPGGRILVETWNRDSLIARAMKARWQQATPSNLGILIDSPAPPSAVFRHLREIFVVRKADGQEYFFRYYDPRVLRTYLPTCNRDELAEFFGPLTGLIAELESGDGFELFRRDDRGNLERLPRGFMEFEEPSPEGSG